MERVKVIEETFFARLKLFYRGKTRDSWKLPGDKLMMVATDKISAFDRVVGLVPEKGRILTKMCEFWFGFVSRELGIKTHFISTDLNDADGHDVWPYAYDNDLEGRTMVVKRADVIPVECVVRGYLAGSALKEYRETGKVCGIELPPGLREGDKLPEPIFTPANKAKEGHDENITFELMSEIISDWMRKNGIVVGAAEEVAGWLAEWLKSKSILIFKKASDYAESRGIIIADTKFEFGWLGDEPILVDEVLTPDSSRFWSLEEWEPGKPQKSFDKQYLRDYLTEEANWDKESPPPPLPDEVVEKTREKYQEALKILVPENF